MLWVNTFANISNAYANDCGSHCCRWQCHSATPPDARKGKVFIQKIGVDEMLCAVGYLCGKAARYIACDIGFFEHKSRLCRPFPFLDNNIFLPDLKCFCHHLNWSPPDVRSSILKDFCIENERIRSREVSFAGATPPSFFYRFARHLVRNRFVHIDVFVLEEM